MSAAAASQWPVRLSWALRLLLPALLPAACFQAVQAARPITPAGEMTALFTLRGHAAGIFHVTYSPDGHYLATTSKDRTIRLWDARTGQPVRTLAGHGGDVFSSAFSPDSRLLASAGEDRQVKIWDVASGKELRACTGHSGDVYNVAFAPDGQTLASASLDGTVRLWDVATGKLSRTLQGHTHRVITVAFSPDGTRLASACATANGSAAGGEVKVWDAASGQELYTLPTSNLGVIAVAFSPDGKRLAGACLRHTVKVWELATGRETLTLQGHTLEVYHVAFSPDGRHLASCSGKWNLDRGGEVKVWELPDGREVLSFKPHTTPLWAVAFSPDSRRLATATGKFNHYEAGEVKVWDVSGLTRVEPAAPPTPGDLEQWWADLAGDDPARAYRAVGALSAAPRQSLPFLRDHVRPPADSLGYERIPRLIAQLDDDAFAVRQRASAELERMGPAAHPALRRALQSPSAEVRRRALLLLEKKGMVPPPPPGELRALRAIEVLQRIGTPEVRPVLEGLAKGPPGSPVALDAAAALRCLAHTPVHFPGGDR